MSVGWQWNPKNDTGLILPLFQKMAQYKVLRVSLPKRSVWASACRKQWKWKDVWLMVTKGSHKANNESTFTGRQKISDWLTRESKQRYLYRLVLPMFQTTATSITSRTIWKCAWQKQIVELNTNNDTCVASRKKNQRIFFVKLFSSIPTPIPVSLLFSADRDGRAANEFLHAAPAEKVERGRRLASEWIGGIWSIQASNEYRLN